MQLKMVMSKIQFKKLCSVLNVTFDYESTTDYKSSV